ncbi:hypothetical protein PBI_KEZIACHARLES14_42 [Mycobacterium phage Keziacharles14]|nr:hypothetical protein PBI_KEZIACHARLES14_42 [Mycobacterium phage Keziacharles14]
MIATWPQWALTASNSDTESLETGTVVLTLSSRIKKTELIAMSDDPSIAELLGGLS